MTRTESAAAHLRAPEVLVRQRDALTSAATFSDFQRGARDALAWLVAGGPSPINGCLVGLPVPARAVVHELAAAEAVLSGASGGGRSYAAGVEHALMWAEFVTPEPPAAAWEVVTGRR